MTLLTKKAEGLSVGYVLVLGQGNRDDKEGGGL
jgi:hypothetical protein